MEVSGTIQCPFCGQAFELVVDTSSASQRFTTDCEICCRPFEVVAECEPGEILSKEVHPQVSEIKEGMEEMIAVVKENSENNPLASKKKGH